MPLQTITLALEPETIKDLDYLTKKRFDITSRSHFMRKAVKDHVDKEFKLIDEEAKAYSSRTKRSY